MCGVTGFATRRPRGSADELRASVLAMTRQLAHRGPDNEGCWIDSDVGVALGHRRLSIIDLSSHGNQPMVLRAGRYVLDYNGEIYNFGGLKDELSRLGRTFVGGSDTEVLLSAIEVWGLAGALKRCNGMFALAVWDRQDRTLQLARDRLGEKPLYYGWSGSTFLFGSELKALRAHPDWQATIDLSALAAYLRHGFVPAPLSIYLGIRKLPAGTICTIDLQRHDMPDPIPYWSLNQAVDAGASRRSLPFDETGDLSHLEAVLSEAVASRMVADVPVGAFLSGGIDSSLVTALMQTNSSGPVKTFTIGYTESDYDECADARRVANHLGTDHTEMRLGPVDVLGVVPELPTMYDEPFGDSSQLPTYLVSKLARGSVKVALSGDGGDELFAGYNRYTWSRRVWRTSSKLPRPVRRSLAKSLAAMPSGASDRALTAFGHRLPRRLRPRNVGTKLQKLASVLPADSPETMYELLTDHWADLPVPVRQASGGSYPLTPTRADLGDPIERMMWADTLTYLPDDMLTKVDRASMAVSLEVRVPLLDHRVVEEAWSIPLDAKVRGTQGKWALRQILYRHVPPQFVDRPKMGFGVPVGAWLRGPLRDWAEDLLDEGRLDREGFLDPAAISSAWAQHQSGKRNLEGPLWPVLMFQSWLASQPRQFVG